MSKAMVMGMDVCPCCGYDPRNKSWATDDMLLKKRQMDNYMRIHAQQSFWFSQPKLICQWVKNMGINPGSILDAGCGDARWIPGIMEIWPESQYWGVDRLEDHIRNNTEAFPEHNFALGNIQDMHSERPYDLVIIGGTFNPRMQEAEQTAFINAVKSFHPKNIVVLFDFNSTGTRPDGEFLPEYPLDNWFVIPKDQQSPFQDVRVFLYRRSNDIKTDLNS